MGTIASIIGLIATNAPILLPGIQRIIDAARQKNEMTDEEHAAFIKMIQDRSKTDPAWQIRPD